MKRIYLDHNATTPVHPDVLEEMLLYLRGGFGNPSSMHWFGQVARKGVELARLRVEDLIGADRWEIVFVSGGTEADNYAIRGVAERSGGGGGHIITTAIEHPAVLNACRYLEKKGFDVTYLPVDEYGRVDPIAVDSAIEADTILISVMLANNDVGTIQPVREIAGIARARGILMHTDAVQAVGKIPLDVKELGVDLLSISGHKLHGPKGIGALYVRHGVKIAPLVHGGHHERKRRAGTENVPAIAGFGMACEIARKELETAMPRIRALRDRLEEKILASTSPVRINGHTGFRLPNTSNLTFADLDAEILLMNLDLKGIAVSTGSACSTGTVEPSHVLRAMGRSAGEARGSLRVSLGRDTTESEVDLTVEAMIEILGKLRKTNPALAACTFKEH